MDPKFVCPCCGFFTLPEEPTGNYNICPVCYWEDDPVQNNDPYYADGANVPSLNEERTNFRLYSAIEPRFRPYVRAPRAEERPAKTSD